MRVGIFFLAFCVATSVAFPTLDVSELLGESDRDVGGQGLSEEDFENGKKIDEENEISEGENPIQDAIEKGDDNDEDTYEGDIKLTDEQKAMVENGGQRELTRALYTARWPITTSSETGGPEVKIPYVLSRNEFTSNERAHIARAISDFETYTCIRLHPSNYKEPNYIKIIRSSGCWSKLGLQGGRQDLSLGTGCASNVGTPIHEFMHALGYLHEQSRKDRDKYVTIHWENIKDDKTRNFNICYECDNQGLDYDPSSVMHYGGKAFSKNNKATITLKQGSGSIGQRDGFSVLDYEGINKIYCDNFEPTTLPPCVDQRPDCSENAEFCHLSVLQEKCPITCNSCP